MRHPAWRHLVDVVAFNFLVLSTGTACFHFASPGHLHNHSHFSCAFHNCLSEVAVEDWTAPGPLSCVACRTHFDRVLLFVGFHCRFFAAVVQWNVCPSARVEFFQFTVFVLELTNFFLHRDIWNSARTFENDRIKRKIKLTKVELTKVYCTSTSFLPESNSRLSCITAALYFFMAGLS